MFELKTQRMLILLMLLPTAAAMAQLPMLSDPPGLKERAQARCAAAGVSADAIAGLAMRACVADLRSQAVTTARARTLTAYIDAIDRATVHMPVTMINTLSLVQSKDGRAQVPSGGQAQLRAGSTCLWQRYRSVDGQAAEGESGVFDCGVDGKTPSTSRGRE